MIDLQRNNLDHIRLLLASLVFFFHAAVLSGADDLSWINYFVSADLAVKGFFVVSGFLVFMSYERSRGLGDYFSKRVRRLFPGYAAVVIISSIGLFWVSSLSCSQYFGFGFLRYLVANLSFLNFLGPALPGVFATNELTAVNGALWTLKIEVMFYLFVPLLFWVIQKWRPITILLAIYLLSLTYFHIFTHLEAGPDSLSDRLARQLPGQLSYFVAGVGVYLYRFELEKFLNLKTLLFSLTCIILERFFGFVLMEPFALAIVILIVAFYHPLKVNVCRYGDLSYGVYIVHFPLIQILIQKQYFAGNAFKGLFFSSILVYSVAFILWHLVEKRFLRRSSHYLAAAKSGIDGFAVGQGGEKDP